MAGYGTDEGFGEWLTANGYVLPSGALSEAVLRQRGSAYLDGQYGARFSGCPSGGYDQERAWPRKDAFAYDAAIPDDVIPDAVIQASYHAALYEAESPGGLAVTATGAGQIKREKTDVLETEYFQGSGDALADATPTLSAVEGLVRRF